MTVTQSSGRAQSKRNDPPTASQGSTPGVENPGGLRVDEQTVIGWFLNGANHAEALEHLPTIEVRHFLTPAHQEIFGTVMTHAGAPNIFALVMTDLSADTAHKSVRSLPGGLLGYLSECKEYADLLEERQLAYHVGKVRTSFVRRKRFELHSEAGRALERDDLDSYEETQARFSALLAEPVDDDNEERFPQIDWDEAFAMDFSHMNWLPGRFMERGQQATLVGDGKVGKSLFTLDWVIRCVTGRAFLGDERRDPVKVLYFDRENSLRDIITRARAFGATPDNLRGLLSYRQFPRFSGTLDQSSESARQFLGIVQEVNPHIVILDTASRFIGGKENDSDTWLQLYQLIHGPLKALDVACVRLDHFGKDSEKGSRGSSAKTQDVDHVWEMRRLQEQKASDGLVDRITTTIKMTRTHTRSGLGEDELVVVRRGERRVGGMWLDGRTAHEIGDTGLVAQQRRELCAIVDSLEAAGVPPDLGRDKLKSWMTLKGMATVKNDVMGEIVRELKVRRSIDAHAR